MFSVLIVTFNIYPEGKVNMKLKSVIYNKNIGAIKVSTWNMIYNEGRRQEKNF